MRHPFLIRILEVLTVLCNLAYTILYLNTSPWCFLFGIAGPLFLAVLSFRTRLYADIVLQLVYVAMAVYGLMSWGGEWQESVWTGTTHLLVIGVSLLSTGLVYLFLRKRTDDSMPLADSSTLVFGVAGTWAMVNFVHANWIYFMGVNAVSAYMFARRKMYLLGLMYLLYLAMSVDGYFRLGVFS